MHCTPHKNNIHFHQSNGKVVFLVSCPTSKTHFFLTTYYVTMEVKTLIILIISMATTAQDYLLTCSRPTTTPRTPKHLVQKIVQKIPCDLSQVGYCGLPGEAYPWPSVRRFVSENQGMMRRMYGELRELNLVRSEVSEVSNHIDDYDKRSIEVSEETTMETITESSNSTENTEQPAETMERSMEKLRLINACPVREEVVAPYWANNTRGEVLALLNLYPFEQYVHFEKCNHDEKSFCQEGCSCHQQHRLHRLLAFDPTNECRGIFSDWFRFPSCCVCKCLLSEEVIQGHVKVIDLKRNPRVLDFDFDYDGNVEEAPGEHFFYGPR